MKAKKLISLLTAIVMTLSLLSGFTAMAEDSAVTSITGTVGTFSRYLGITSMNGLNEVQSRIGIYNDWFNKIEYITAGVTDKESNTFGMKFDISDVVDAGFIKSAKVKVHARQLKPYIKDNSYTALYIDGKPVGSADEKYTIKSNWEYKTDLYPMTTDWTYKTDVVNPKNTGKTIKYAWDKVDYSEANWGTYPDFSAYGNYYPNINSATVLASAAAPATGNGEYLDFEYDVTENLIDEKMAGKGSVAYTLVDKRMGNTGNAIYDEMNCLDGKYTTATLEITAYSSEEITTLLDAITDADDSNIEKYLQAILGNNDSSYKSYRVLSKTGKSKVNASIVKADITDADVLKTVIDEAVAAYLASGDIAAEDKDGAVTSYDTLDIGFFNVNNGRLDQYRIGLSGFDGVSGNTVTLGAKFSLAVVPSASLIKSARISYTAKENNAKNTTYNTNVYPMTTEWPADIGDADANGDKNSWTKDASSYSGYPNLSGLTALDFSSTEAIKNNNNTLTFTFDITDDLKAKKATAAAAAAYALGVKRTGSYVDENGAEKTYATWQDEDCLNGATKNQLTATASLIIETYNEEYLIENLKNINNTDDFGEYVKTIIGVSDSTVKAYSKLTDEGKSAVINLMATASYNDKAELKAALENAISSYLASDGVNKNDKSGNTVSVEAIDYGGFSIKTGTAAQWRVGLVPDGAVNVALQSHATGMKFDLSELAELEYIKDVELFYGVKEQQPKTENLVYKTAVYPMTTDWPLNEDYQAAKDVINATTQDGKFISIGWKNDISTYTGYPNVADSDYIDMAEAVSVENGAYIDFSFDVTSDLKAKIASNNDVAAYTVINRRYNNEITWSDDNCLQHLERHDFKLNVTYISDELILEKYNAANDKAAVVENILKIEEYDTNFEAAELAENLAATYSTYNDLLTAIKAKKEVEIIKTDAGFSLVNNTSKTLPVYAFTASYKDNKLVELIKVDIPEIAGKATVPVNPELTNNDYTEAYLFCWDGLISIKPYCDNVSLN